MAKRKPRRYYRLCALIGHKGVGKTTILKELLNYPEFNALKTYTDRPRRPEEDEIETRFRTSSEIDELLSDDVNILQESSYRGFRYCTLWEDWNPQAILVRPILWDGVEKLEGSGLFDVLRIAITSPSMEVYHERIANRSDYGDLKEVLDSGINTTMPPECPPGRTYNHVVVNYDVANTSLVIRGMCLEHTWR